MALEAFRSHDRIRVVRIDDGLLGNASLFRYARDLGNRGDMNEIGLWEDSIVERRRHRIRHQYSAGKRHHPRNNGWYPCCDGNADRPSGSRWSHETNTWGLEMEIKIKSLKEIPWQGEAGAPMATLIPLIDPGNKKNCQ